MIFLAGRPNFLALFGWPVLARFFFGPTFGKAYVYLMTALPGGIALAEALVVRSGDLTLYIPLLNPRDS